MGHVQSEVCRPESIALDEPTNPRESRIYRSVHCFRENGGRLISRIRLQPESKTAIELLQGTAIHYPDVETAGERYTLPDGTVTPYQYTTYKQYFSDMISFGKSLLDLGLQPGDRLGLYAHNSRMFQIASYGAYSVGMTIVPVYDSLGPNAAVYVATHSEIKALFTNGYKYENAAKIVNQVDAIKLFIFSEDEDKIPPNVECRLKPLLAKELIEKGRNSQQKSHFPKPKDTAMIMYTSGTTGDPKGCVISHKNFISGASGFQNANLSGTPDDLYLSFLPLAHIMAQSVELLFMAQGIRVAYARGPVKYILEDVALLQPTVVAFVPRVYNRIYEAMNNKVNQLPPLLQKLIRWNIHHKFECMKQNKPHSLLLDILFKDFRAALGGRLRFIISGGAPIMPEVFEFIAGAVTPNTVQGYGNTEGTGGVSVQELPCDDPELIPPSHSVDIKLIPVPGNPDYDPTDPVRPTGELLIRGPLVFQGYFKQPELTEKAFQNEWFRTGDVVQLINGKMKFIDRVKSIVKLSQGEYISLTYLTEMYSMAKDVSFVYIYASPEHDSPVAAVVPSSSKIKEWEDQGIKDIVNNPQCKEYLINNLHEQFVLRKMRGFEKIDKILIDLEEPTTENGLLTPSMKPNSKNVRARWDQKLISLYKE